tara:strand:- start:17625 stop:18932 length:1308 start_codon:yes stop_codon:yes gene_type:complete
MHKTYLTPIAGVESLSDSIRKNPALISAAKTVGTAVAPLALDMVVDKVRAKRKEATQAEEELQQATEQAQREQQNTPNPQAEASIEGMDAANSAPPTEQPGAELPAQAPLDLTRTWFIDNFGMTGREMSEILIKARDLKTLDLIQPLLKMEKQAILNHFTGVSGSLVGRLPLTDMDYDALNKNTKRLDLPFRRFVKSWTGSDTEGRVVAEDLWRTTIDKSERLSNRERNLLENCREVLTSRGALNAQTLKSYGVNASPAEISSIIKSHGFLYDIIAVGQFSKSIGRGLFYDVRRRDVLLKDADRFIAGLMEHSAIFKLDSRLNPRIEMRFYAPTAPWYATALNKTLGGGVSADSIGLVIEGEKSVFKALELAEPHLNGNASSAKLMLKGLRGNDDALIVLAYDSLPHTEQNKLLKKHRITDEGLKAKREEVLTHG